MTEPSIFVALTLVGRASVIIVNLTNINCIQRSEVGTLLRSICGKHVFMVVETPDEIERKRSAAKPIRRGVVLKLQQRLE